MDVQSQDLNIIFTKFMTDIDGFIDRFAGRYR